ncbi:MAG: hypothetical protein H7Z11_16420 [Verrucomicrobia bacterium]|nr:hypothetical protein [Leptolyngbya sp. ES-bin-22]
MVTLKPVAQVVNTLFPELFFQHLPSHTNKRLQRLAKAAVIHPGFAFVLPEVDPIVEDEEQDKELLTFHRC